MVSQAVFPSADYVLEKTFQILQVCHTSHWECNLARLHSVNMICWKYSIECQQKICKKKKKIWAEDEIKMDHSRYWNFIKIFVCKLVWQKIRWIDEWMNLLYQRRMEFNRIVVSLCHTKLIVIFSLQLSYILTLFWPCKITSHSK